MRACLAPADSVVASAVDCVACAVVAVATHVDGGYTASGRRFSHEDLYKDYSGPDQQAGVGGGYPAGYDAGYPGPGARGYPGGGYGVGEYEVEPSCQIMVRNVSRPVLALL